MLHSGDDVQGTGNRGPCIDMVNVMEGKGYVPSIWKGKCHACLWKNHSYPAPLKKVDSYLLHRLKHLSFDSWISRVASTPAL